VIAMGSGSETCEEAAAWLNERGEGGGAEGAAVPALPGGGFHQALPRTVRSIACWIARRSRLAGEPLYLDVVTALAEARASGYRVSSASRCDRRPIRAGVEGV